MKPSFVFDSPPSHARSSTISALIKVNFQIPFMCPLYSARHAERVIRAISRRQQAVTAGYYADKSSSELSAGKINGERSKKHSRELRGTAFLPRLGDSGGSWWLWCRKAAESVTWSATSFNYKAAFADSQKKTRKMFSILKICRNLNWKKPFL